MAVPFDAKRLAVTGRPLPVVEGIMRTAERGNPSGSGNFDVSSAGALTYVPASSRFGNNQAVLALLDRNGKSQVLGLPAGSYADPRISPDGRQLVVSTDEASAIGIYDLSASSSLR